MGWRLPAIVIAADLSYALIFLDDWTLSGFWMTFALRWLTRFEDCCFFYEDFLLESRWLSNLAAAAVVVLGPAGGSEAFK